LTPTSRFNSHDDRPAVLPAVLSRGGLDGNRTPVVFGENSKINIIAFVFEGALQLQGLTRPGPRSLATLATAMIKTLDQVIHAKITYIIRYLM
jgi:hypothetical protein